MITEHAWIRRGFESFSEGRFEDGGSNFYVNAKGIIETIHRTDVDNDGYVDLVLPNAQGYNARTDLDLQTRSRQGRDVGTA